MMHLRFYFTLFLAACFAAGAANAQSVEAYAGHKRAGVDLMWFRNFKDKKEARTPFLFFSRNRASVDYLGAPAVFASTNAVSYNLKNGLGFVVVGSFLQSGFTAKTGVQLVKMKGDFLFFGWLVADLKKDGNVDLFGLFRYQPKLSGPYRWFTQLELFPVYHPANQGWNLTQRLRLGVKYRAWAVGMMSDFNQAKTETWIKTRNSGAFLRYEF